MTTWFGPGSAINTAAWQQFANALDPARTTSPTTSSSSTATTAPATGTPAGALTPAELQSARAMVQKMVDAWGLGSLADWAWNRYLNGEPPDAIKFDITQTPEYKQRFPGMAALQAKGQAISEAEYMIKEAADTELLRAYGLHDYATRDLLGELIGNQVGTTELQNRLEDRRLLVEQLPQEVRDFAQRKMGLNTGDLMGLYLNPKIAETQIRQKLAASEIGGAAARAGFNNLSPDVAAQLAGLRANQSGLLDFGSAAADFQKASLLRALTQSLPGQAPALPGEMDLINAEVGGNAQALTAIQREQERRKAMFSDNFGVATTAKGVEGLASANV